MNITDKKIGIWGLGVLGKSACRYLSKKGVALEVLDARHLTPEEHSFLDHHHIPYYQQAQNLDHFLERNDIIIPSSGIDLRPHAHYHHKWLTELDFFYHEFKQPIIAITGTIGKTSTTQLLGQLLQQHALNVTIGGNIGVGLFDMLSDSSNMAVIEVSSFQLEYSRFFAPNIAIWTNLYPNHLDRHQDQEAYRAAKYKILARQQAHDHAIVPLDLQAFINTQQAPGLITFFTRKTVDSATLSSLRPRQQLLYVHNNGSVMRHEHGKDTMLWLLSDMPQLSFTDNWLMIIAALTVLEIPLDILTEHRQALNIPEHRLELIPTQRKIHFYNDSKSTTPQATLAALEQLQGHRIHLFVGGISKGVNRAPFIQELTGKVHSVYCFGTEADELNTWCRQYAITSSAHATLEAAFAHCCSQLKEGDTVLFSPAGASFDLFAHYQARGATFKALVHQFLEY